MLDRRSTVFGKLVAHSPVLLRLLPGDTAGLTRIIHQVVWRGGGAEQALGFWYDLVAEAGSPGANGDRTRHAARYGDFAAFASGRGQAG